jgi:hypothetical protein
MTVNVAWRSGDRAAAWDALWHRILRDVLLGDECSAGSAPAVKDIDERAQEQGA